MSLTNLYVHQDKDRFYFHVTDGPEHQLIAPIRIVSDYDLEGARRARAWFKRQCKKNGYRPRWEKIPA